MNKLLTLGESYEGSLSKSREKQHFSPFPIETVPQEPPTNLPIDYHRDMRYNKGGGSANCSKGPVRWNRKVGTELP